MLGFPRHARITRGAELQRIAREGKRIRAGHLDVRVVASPLAHPASAHTRIGLVVPRYRHSAVARNQLKRRLRELARLQLLPVGLSLDIVVRIRPEAYALTFDQLREDVDRMLMQLARWSPPPVSIDPAPAESVPPSAPSVS